MAIRKFFIRKTHKEIAVKFSNDGTAGSEDLNIGSELIAPAQVIDPNRNPEVRIVGLHINAVSDCQIDVLRRRTQVRFSGGHGTGAAATAHIENGSVTRIQVTTAGKGYTENTLVVLKAAAGEGIGYYGARAHAVIAGGAIRAIVVDYGGTNYTTAPTVEIMDFGWHHTYADARFPVAYPTVGSTNGDITAIAVEETGNMFTTVPDVEIVGDNPGTAMTPGVDAAATATLDAKVVNIGVLEGGFGYDVANPPAVTIAAPPSGGTPATATAVVERGGIVTAVNVTAEGAGYDDVPAVTIAAPAANTVAWTGGFATANKLFFIESHSDHARAWNPDGNRDAASDLYLGTGTWIGGLATPYRMFVIDQFRNVARALDLNGVRDPGSDINLGSGTWVGGLATGSRMFFIDTLANYARAYHFDGTRDSSADLNLGTGGWNGGFATATTMFFVDTTANAVRAWNLNGTRDAASDISLGSTTWTGGLASRDRMYFIDGIANAARAYMFDGTRDATSDITFTATATASALLEGGIKETITVGTAGSGYNGDLEVMNFEGFTNETLDFADNKFAELEEADRDIVVKFNDKKGQIYLLLHKHTGFLTTQERAEYGSYDNPDRRGRKAPAEVV